MLLRKESIIVIAVITLASCQRVESAGQKPLAPSASSAPTKTPPSGFDFDPAEGRCNPDDNSPLREFRKNLGYIEMVLPNVPPEEASYLDAEQASALKMAEQEDRADVRANAQLNARFNSLHRRPLWFVYQVRKAEKAASASLSEIENSNGFLPTYLHNPAAQSAEQALSMMYKSTALQSALADLVNDAEIHGSTYISSQQYVMLDVMRLDFDNELARFASCKLARVMGRQTFP